MKPKIVEGVIVDDDAPLRVRIVVEADVPDVETARSVASLFACTARVVVAQGWGAGRIDCDLFERVVVPQDKEVN
jgi:hypothetical protein